MSITFASKKSKAVKPYLLKTMSCKVYALIDSESMTTIIDKRTFRRIKKNPLLKLLRTKVRLPHNFQKKKKKKKRRKEM